MTIKTKVAEFECSKPGRNSRAVAKGGVAMPLHSEMAINGKTDLSGVVKGNSGACVYGVRLIESANPLYKYQMQVDAKGPKGMGSGSLHLLFEDETRDGYKLAITSSTRKPHTVSFNSDKLGIVRFDWGDKIIK